MKKTFILLSAAAVCVVLGACAGNQGNTKQQAQTGPEAQQTKAQEKASQQENGDSKAAESKAGENRAADSSVENGKSEASAWPEKTVQITVPYKAGGGVDKAARLVCSALEKETGKSFVITNKPEGNGIVATNELLSQAPDGYTLEVVSVRDIFGHIVNKIEGVKYGKDSFTYIASLLEPADAIYTQTGKYPSFDDLIAAAKENPGKYTVAIANNTGLQTLGTINEQLGIELNGIVYSSGAEAFADLMGGHVEACMVATSFCPQAYENGCAPVVTMTGRKYDSLDNVPCIIDYKVEGAVSPMNRLLIGPAGIPDDVVDGIVAKLDAVYQPDGELMNQINSQYDMPTYLTGDELMKFIDDNFAFREEQAAANQ